MKKITLLFTMFGLMVSTTSLTAQTFYSVAMNGGTTYQSDVAGERFAGYPWGGVGNHVINNANSSVSLAITNYDETNPEVGSELYIRFSRVGFGVLPLDWGSDNVTEIVTLTPADFTAGSATVNVNIPGGTVPVAQTADYETGYLYILQIVGANLAGTTYINYVVDIAEEILSTNDFNMLESSFYSASKDAIVLNNNNIIGDYRIYDITGRMIVKGILNEEISVSELKSGVYFLTTDIGGTLKFAK